MSLPAILFTGITGLGKRELLRKLAFSLTQRFFTAEESHDVAVRAERYFPVIDLCGFYPQTFPEP